MKVAIYCRVSTEDQDASKQEAICKDYCERNNMEVYRVYKDQGVSGTTTSRPDWNNLLQDLRNFKFRAVVVTKLDRMGRSLSHIIHILGEFRRKGVEFISVTQNIDTSTAAGKLQMQIMGAFAEFERNLISERTKEGMRGVKNVGKRGKDKKPRQKRGGLRKSLSI